MNEPTPINQTPPEIHEPQRAQQHVLPVAITASIILMLLIAGSIMLVMFEQRQTKNQTTALTSPSPIPSGTPTATPTPRPTYQPQVEGLSKQEAVNLFKTAAFEKDIYKAGDHVMRWNIEEVSWRLRGQFTDEDRQCMTAIEQQLNTAMEAVQLKNVTDASQTERNRSNIDFYVLPADQFSSIGPDLRPENPAQFLFTQRGHAFVMNSGILDLNQPAAIRCFYMRGVMLQAIGIDSNIINDNPEIALSPNFIDNAQYTPLALEMVRIMYSPLLTAGLSQAEVERRLLQE